MINLVCKAITDYGLSYSMLGSLSVCPWAQRYPTEVTERHGFQDQRLLMQTDTSFIFPRSEEYNRPYIHENILFSAPVGLIRHNIYWTEKKMWQKKPKTFNFVLLITIYM